jgi:hypothetical protein
MDSTSIIDYIKKNYPQVVFTPFKFQKSRALAFILDDNNLVIGFINSNGTLCKLIEPIDTSLLSNENMQTIIQKLPIVKGFAEKDKQRLLRLFENKEESVSKSEHKKIINDLEMRINDLEKSNNLDKIKMEEDYKKSQEYKTLYDSKSNQVIFIQKEYEDKIKIINDQYISTLKQLDECKSQIINQKDAIVEGINKYKDEIKEFVTSKDLQIQDLEKITKQYIEERKVLQERLDLLLQNEKESMNNILSNKDTISEYDNKLKEKTDTISELQNAIETIKSELSNVKKELTQNELQNQLLNGYKIRCKDKVLNEKTEIINAIQDYNQKWNEWAKNINYDVTEYKRKLLLELKTVQENLKDVLNSNIESSNLSDKEIQRLKQNIVDIETALKQTINDQMIHLSEKDAQIKSMEKNIQDLTSENSSFTERSSKMQSEINTLQQQKRLQEVENATLQKRLQEVEKLLLQNNNTRIETQVDYDNCYSIITNFVALNNIFFRKQEIIKILDDIISNNLGSFNTLNDTIKTSIKSDFEKIKTEITNHIRFLNLTDYIKSPNFEYLKSKSSRNRVPESFCKDISNLLEYWNVNKFDYREQDRLLTNIYEDLSGAVRIYIRIKPLVGKENTNNTVQLQTVENKKLKFLNVDCSSNPDTKYKERRPFGEFYGIYEEDYNNLDIYTGQQGTIIQDPNSLRVNINDIIESSDSISPGLYSTFKQVEDGYSIVIFGYGLSGSGKTFSLLGNKGSPGILHYGLTNLEGVSNIKLKYLFEQYYNRINLNNRQVSGNIHNLINKVPQLKDVSRDETTDFEKRIPSYINIKDLKVADIYALTDIIDKYRIEYKRIKMTPNNPVSSRSHLYLVFEIQFTNGKIGYVTIVDTAGRESPMDIFNTFIDTSRGNSIQSVMAPPPVGGVGNIERSLKPEYKDTYDPSDIFDILNEGFYINETINHLIYYFNVKNGKQIETPKQKMDKRYNVVYKVKNYFVQPKDEDEKIDVSNNALMIPILKFLDNLSNKNKSDTTWRPTKFITLCCVRQEEKYCDQTMETLEFAQNVKSS